MTRKVLFALLWLGDVALRSAVLGLVLYIVLSIIAGSKPESAFPPA